jgi:peptide chain release factor 1
LFKNEISSHRWHRIPPTERRGRVHTSTITVAILETSTYQDIEIDYSELKIETTRGSGNGGQRRNSTDSCVIVTHIPTGIKVVRDGRHQVNNKIDALAELTRRVNYLYRTGYDEEVAENRREQIGDGERSDKRRTYRVRDNIVTDHITGKSITIKELFKGRIDLLS